MVDIMNESAPKSLGREDNPPAWARMPATWSPSQPRRPVVVLPLRARWVLDGKS
jgi:hypothetical protein